MLKCCLVFIASVSGEVQQELYVNCEAKSKESFSKGIGFSQGISFLLLIFQNINLNINSKIYY
jgi:hypothetical protein